MALDQKLLSPRERTLFTIGVAFSGLCWLALVVSIVGIVYGAAIGLLLLSAQALHLAHVRGNAVRLSARQMPELHARVTAAAERLGLRGAPEAYVIQSGGVVNAFAMKLLSRQFVVLNSELVRECADPRQLDFVVGHEVGHLAAGHLRWNLFLAPYRLVPWLGAAYSRAREYTCDRCGLAFSGDLEQSMRGLVVLAAGSRVAGEASLEEFMAQTAETGGFWMAVFELVSSHPYLCKRVAALRKLGKPQTVAAVPRSAFAWLFAPLLGGFAGGTAGAPLAAVAMIGILAAIAIPNFVRYQERARHARAAASSPIAQPLAGDEAAPPAGALSADDRASLEWVRQVRAQVEAKERGRAAQR
ncbi:MAG TPA: M48 family metallopeptidase [Anaeromyxobacteraceae bacterium]|jgi:Zn-dependent protease with chaperone function|nr:M48 family metallopeptidase [Anaeromyxobacteraceae bacterium]